MLASVLRTSATLILVVLYFTCSSWLSLVTDNEHLLISRIGPLKSQAGGAGTELAWQL